MMRISDLLVPDSETCECDRRSKGSVHEKRARVRPEGREDTENRRDAPNRLK